MYRRNVSQVSGPSIAAFLSTSESFVHNIGFILISETVRWKSRGRGEREIEKRKTDADGVANQVTATADDKKSYLIEKLMVFVGRFSTYPISSDKRIKRMKSFPFRSIFLLRRPVGPALLRICSTKKCNPCRRVGSIRPPAPS
jgi:hypothetical protein